MLTFTQRKQELVKMCSIHYEEPIMGSLVRWMAQADKMFQNSARRSWINKEKKTDLVHGQRYYQLANDMHRVADIRCKIATDSEIIMPITEVQSESEWNALIAVPFSSSYPTHYFVKGGEQIGLYPTPSQDVTDGLIVTYEPRVRDMQIDDFKFKADVTENGVEVKNPDREGLPDGFKPWMEGDFWLHATDSADGNWYRVQKYMTPQIIRLDNNFLGKTGTQVELEMGQVAPYPEEYHDAPVNYACHKFFAMRKDTDSAAMYLTLFQDQLQQYRETYGSKTTSGVINAGQTRVPNISDVFKNSTLVEGA